MALRNRKRLDVWGDEIDPQQVYVASDGFCAVLDGKEVSFPKGSRRRGSDAAVRAYGQWWYPDGGPEKGMVVPLPDYETARQ